MRVISKSRLKEFWSDHKDAQGPLSAWRRVVEGTDWENWGDLKSTYPAADKVGRCVVFNIGGNKYRLIASVRYKKPAQRRGGRVYVRRILTHAEYDKGTWKNECC